MRHGKLLLVLGALPLLAACGDTLAEQGLYGAGAGAVAGEVIANEPVVGALGGAAANVAYCQANPGKC